MGMRPETFAALAHAHRDRMCSEFGETDAGAAAFFHLQDASKLGHVELAFTLPATHEAARDSAVFGDDAQFIREAAQRMAVELEDETFFTLPVQHLPHALVEPGGVWHQCAVKREKMPHDVFGACGRERSQRSDLESVHAQLRVSRRE